MHIPCLIIDSRNACTTSATYIHTHMLTCLPAASGQQVPQIFIYVYTHIHPHICSLSFSLSLSHTHTHMLTCLPTASGQQVLCTKQVQQMGSFPGLHSSTYCCPRPVRMYVCMYEYKSVHVYVCICSRGVHSQACTVQDVRVLMTAL